MQSGKAEKGLTMHRSINLMGLHTEAIYALRKTIVEPVFGQIKGARGLDRFRLRGLEKVNGNGR